MPCPRFTALPRECLHRMPHSALKPSLRGRYYYFIDVETEALKAEGTCLLAFDHTGQEVVALGSELQ